MQEARHWRDLLGIIIKDNKEKQYLIETLKISPITLTRWVNGESDPRPQNLRQLVNALPPKYQELMRKLLKEEQEFGDFTHPILEPMITTIPSEFHARVLAAYASTTENLRYWSICHLILQQILQQLDPDRHGLATWILRCMPPSGPDYKVRSLHESIGMGTPPWPENLELQTSFLGAGSPAEITITHQRPYSFPNLNNASPSIYASRNPIEKSIALSPIMSANRIAGVLIASSIHANYFLEKTHTDLLQQYANLISLAFEPTDFYAVEDIALGIMPSRQEQQKYLSRFRQILVEEVLDADRRQNPIELAQVEKRVWQILEDQLLTITTSDKENLIHAASNIKSQQLRESSSSYMLSESVPSIAQKDSPAETDKRTMLSLSAIASINVEDHTTVLVGKIHTLSAGITQVLPEGFEHHSFSMLQSEGEQNIAFNISLHANDNIKIIGEWNKDFIYKTTETTLQTVDFLFMAQSSGVGLLILDFYYRQHLISTIQIPVEAKEIQVDENNE